MIPASDTQVGWYMNRTFDAGLRVDVRDADAVDKAMSERFDVCIHCVADPNLVSCEDNPDAAWLLNVTGTQNVVSACERMGVRLVHVSTDGVFDGTSDSPYSENADRNPLQTYGKTKAAAEDAVAALDGALIVRIPLLYGRANNTSRETWIEQCIAAFNAGKTITADDKEIRQPAAAQDIARALVQLGIQGEGGVVHVAPNQTLTKFAWTRLIAATLGFNPDLVVPSYETTNGPPRPLRSVLATERMTSLGITAPRDASQVLDDIASGNSEVR